MGLFAVRHVESFWIRYSVSVSPALAGGFWTTGPESQCDCFFDWLLVLGSFLGWDPSEHSFILSGAIWSCPPLFPSSNTGHLPTWGIHLSVPYLFAFLYSSWGSRSENIGVVCHSVLQWITSCQNSSLWHVYLGWPYTKRLIASLSYANPFTSQAVVQEAGRAYSSTATVPFSVNNSS